MGTLGGILRATAGPPQVSTISSVKNPALAGNINSEISNYGTLQSSQNRALGDYISKYMGGEGAASQRTNQEIGSVGQFYDGSMQSQLAQLRAQRVKAVNDAANVATQQATRGLNSSRLTGDGGTSSYNARTAMGAMIPIRTQAALDNSNQERADLGYVTGNQIALAGTRNRMAGEQAAYGLVPEQTRMQMLQGRLGALGGMTNLDQANTFYGLRQKPNVAADVADSVDQGIMNAAAIYSSVGGGGGGMARGGYVDGPGDETSDSIPARLSDGEFVVPAEGVRLPGVYPLLERIRAMALRIRRQGGENGHGVGGHYRSGGLVVRYADGGGVNFNDFGSGVDWGQPGGFAPSMGGGAGDMWLGDGRNDGGGGGGGGKGSKGGVQQKSGGGGGGGGLAAGAMALGANVTRDLTPQWGSATMVPTDGNGGGVQVPAMTPFGGGGRQPQTQIQPWEMPQPRNEYFTPSNFQEISPKWQSYGSYFSKYYNDPNSPGYVKPGTYE